MTRPAYRVAKRILDLTVSLFGLVLTSPLLLLIAVALFVTSGRPILFRQKRPGLHGRPFTMYKFRSMLELGDARGDPRPDEERLTRFGRLLRSTSLDELPELVNVLKGDMSLVGPRPLLMEYLEKYSPEQARRHDVPPGVTGWAQVNGRNALTWEEKFVLDVWYVDHCGFFLDLKILWLTLFKIVKREGIAPKDRATMPRFGATEK